MKVTNVRFVNSVNVKGLRGEHVTLSAVTDGLRMEIVDGFLHLTPTGGDVTTMVPLANVVWSWGEAPKPVEKKPAAK